MPGITELGRVSQRNIELFRPSVLVTPFVAFKRPARLQETKIVHTVVSLASLDGVFEQDHFDDFDFIVCAGPHQVSSFEEWRASHPNLAGKSLISGGYPKLDWTLRETGELTGANPDANTIVYAPTHIYEVNERLASLRTHGAEIVRALLSRGIRVIFRPHPVSWTDEDAPLVRRIVEEHEGNPGFKVDRSTNYLSSYQESTLMLTDVSGTGFTYAFTFARPAIFFAKDADAEKGLRGLQFESRERIGSVVRTVEDLIAGVSELREQRTKWGEAIETFRRQTIFHLRASGEYITEQIGLIANKQENPDWVKL